MAKRVAVKRKVTKRKAAKRAPRASSAPKRGSSAAEPVPALDLFDAMPAPAGTAATDDTSLHNLFQQQTMAMLDRSDLDEEQKQAILVAMNCPCCGGSGLSFTMKLKRKR
jgi:hypothetical protein